MCAYKWAKITINYLTRKIGGFFVINKWNNVAMCIRWSKMYDISHFKHKIKYRNYYSWRIECDELDLRVVLRTMHCLWIGMNWVCLQCYNLFRSHSNIFIKDLNQNLNKTKAQPTQIYYVLGIKHWKQNIFDAYFGEHNEVSAGFKFGCQEVYGQLFRYELCCYQSVLHKNYTRWSKLGI